MSLAGPAASFKPPQGQKPLHLEKLLAVPGLALVQGPLQGTLHPTGSSCRVGRRADVVPPGMQSLLNPENPLQRLRLLPLQPPSHPSAQCMCLGETQGLQSWCFGKSMGNSGGAGGSAGAPACPCEHAWRVPTQQHRHFGSGQALSRSMVFDVVILWFVTH